MEFSRFETSVAQTVLSGVARKRASYRWVRGRVVEPFALMRRAGRSLPILRQCTLVLRFHHPEAIEFPRQPIRIALRN